MLHQPTNPDTAFLQRLQAGDESAYRELLARWQRPLFSFVYRMTGEADAAEEITQEVFVRVFRKVGDYRQRPGTSAFSTWLFQIARNATLDHQRHRARHPADSLDAMTDAAHSVPAEQPSPAAAAVNADTGTQIAVAVAALPEDQRAALILAEYQELPVAAIAATLGTSEKAVESLLYRARQSLRRRLAHLL